MVGAIHRTKFLASCCIDNGDTHYRTVHCWRLKALGWINKTVDLRNIYIYIYICVQPLHWMKHPSVSLSLYVCNYYVSDASYEYNVSRMFR